jgi:DNA adenine methylase
MRKKSFVINTSAVPNPSPFRYPGGKSWLIPHVRQWLTSLNCPVHFVEPFAGGSNIGLTVALENLADHVTLVELDKDVAAVWQIILSEQANALTKKIIEFPITKTAVRSVLKRKNRSELSRAFAALLKNRVRRGGIMTADASILNSGENGRGIRSRWYPETLKKRIEIIFRNRKKLSFFLGDGLEFIRFAGQTKNIAFFIDPPYTVAGRRLYNHSEIDHRKLFEVLNTVSGNWLLTYENTKDVRTLAKEFGFSTKQVRMRTSHNSVKIELLIGRDFSWLQPRLLMRKSS